MVVNYSKRTCLVRLREIQYHNKNWFDKKLKKFIWKFSMHFLLLMNLWKWLF